MAATATVTVIKKLAEWSGVLRDILTVDQLIKIFPSFNGTPLRITVFNCQNELIESRGSQPVTAGLLPTYYILSNTVPAGLVK
jgi:hypothetical protein